MLCRGRTDVSDLCVNINNCLLGVLEKSYWSEKLNAILWHLYYYSIFYIHARVPCCFSRAKVDIYQRQSSRYLASPGQVKCISWHTISIQSHASFLSLQKYSSSYTLCCILVWVCMPVIPSESPNTFRIICYILHVVYVLATFQGIHSKV